MKVVKSEEELIQLLLNKDETVLAQLYSFFAEMLYKYFLNKFPVFQNDPTELEDIITDSLLELSRNSEKYNPHRASLKTFIIRDVRGNIINAISKKGAKKNIFNNVVELKQVHGNIEDGNDYLNVNHEVIALGLKTFFAHVFPSEKDQILAWMIIVDKTRETEKFGTVLNIQDNDLKEQEEIVKRNKDRIKAKLMRNGFEEFLKKLRSNA